MSLRRVSIFIFSSASAHLYTLELLLWRFLCDCMCHSGFTETETSWADLSSAMNSSFLSLSNRITRWCWKFGSVSPRPPWCQRLAFIWIWRDFEIIPDAVPYVCGMCRRLSSYDLVNMAICLFQRHRQRVMEPIHRKGNIDRKTVSLKRYGGWFWGVGKRGPFTYWLSFNLFLPCVPIYFAPPLCSHPFRRCFSSAWFSVLLMYRFEGPTPPRPSQPATAFI